MSSLANGVWGTTIGAAQTYSTPEQRRLMPFYAPFLAALLEPVFRLQALTWPDLFRLVKSQKGLNGLPKNIARELDRLYGEGFIVVHLDNYIRPKVSYYGIEGQPPQYRYYASEPGYATQYQRYQDEIQELPSFRVIVPDGTMATNEQIDAVVRSLCLAGSVYELVRPDETTIVYPPNE